MIVGVPREIKADENRVAVLPVGVEALVRAGHQVRVESDAGRPSGALDEAYAAAGAEVVKGSEVILGGGVVGSNAARIAAGLGANVFVLDIDLERLRYLEDVMPPNVTTLMSNTYNLNRLVPSADLLIGAVLKPGAKAPHLVTRQMVSEMKEGAVIVDVSVDQGGCVETCYPTTHTDPTFVVDGVNHYCVANIPGAVPRTSTFALTNATLPYVLELADIGWKEAAQTCPELAAGIGIADGKVMHAGVAEAWGLALSPLSEALDACAVGNST